MQAYFSKNLPRWRISIINAQVIVIILSIWFNIIIKSFSYFQLFLIPRAIARLFFLLNALEITSEELFATNKFKDAKDLLQKINENIALIGDDSNRLEIIYNLTKSLVK